MMETFNGRFEVVRKIGTGTYFDAYRAFDPVLRRPVFLKKAIIADRPGAAGIIDAHRDHWRALARVHVGGMPTIFDVFSQDGAWCLVTQWIESPSLRALSDRANRPKNPGRFLLHVLEQGLIVLGDFHDAGMVHADISPGNILIDSRRDGAKLFLIDPAPPLNLPDPADPAMRLILGNPAFAAPEVLAGQPATVRADLFALGKVIAEAAALLGVPSPALVRELTAAQPELRPASAAVALQMLRAVQEGGEGEAGEPGGVVDPGLRLDILASLKLHEQRESRRKARELWSSDTITISNRAVPDAPAWDAEFGDAGPGSSVRETFPLDEPEEAPPPARPVPDSWLAASMAMAVPVPHPSGVEPPIPADFAVVAPNLIQAGRNFVVEIWVAPSGDHAAMLDQATRSGRMVERGGRSHINMARDALITVLLKLPDFEVSDPADTLGWNADIRNVGFIAKAPAALAPGIYPGIAKLMLGQVPFASIMFDLEVVSAERSIEQAPRPREARVQRIARAFASYASQDRAEVLRRVQGIQAAGTNVFLDIIDLRAGELWEPALYREVDASDGLFLFWSKAAKQSPWVDREWRYALDRRGIAFINPLALEDPRDVDPPNELRSKHFNDMLLAFIKVEDARRAGAAGTPS
jgi:hypothetical protein